MPKSGMGLTPGGSSVLDLVKRTGVQGLGAGKLVDLSGSLGKVKAKSRDFGRGGNTVKFGRRLVQ